jgi:DGQHR domain-containing protein
MDTKIEAKFPCLKIEQPIGKFYIGVIDAKSLCDITYADVRRMGEDREVESYLGIQRKLSKKRSNEIREYSRTADACFPTSVILAIPAECATFNEDSHELILNSTTEIPKGKIAKVLDGQHRIEGLRLLLEDEDHLFGDKVKFEINVSIFIDMDIAEQAIVFSTVNLAQTKVNKSLVYDLFEYAKAKSPQKTCHSIAVALNKYDQSPFYERIKRLGDATEGKGNETLTQATFINMIMEYISKDKIQQIQDRDIYLRGGRPKYATEDESKKLIFRNMMIDDEDQKIADVIFNYFSAVQSRWPIAWNQPSQGIMLNRTNGYKALMRFLRDCYLSISTLGHVPSKHDFEEVLAKIDLTDNDFNINNYKPGTSGESALYRDLKDKSRLDMV